MFGNKRASYLAFTFILLTSICGIFPYFYAQEGATEVHSFIEKITKSKIIVYKLSELLVTLEMAEKEYINTKNNKKNKSYLDLKNEIITLALDYSKYVNSTIILKDLEKHFSITKKLYDQKYNKNGNGVHIPIEHEWLWSLTNLHILIGQQINADNKILKLRFERLKNDQRTMKRIFLILGMTNVFGVLIVFSILMKNFKRISDLNSVLEKEIIHNSSLQNKIVSQEKLVAIGRLTSGISHEIKNPLSFLTMSSDLLYNNLNEYFLQYENIIVEKLTEGGRLIFQEDKEEIFYLLESMKEGVLRTDRIVESMANLATDREIRLSHFDFRSAVDEVLASAFRTINWSNTQINIKEIKEYSRPQLLFGDVEFLKIALFNIFLNSYYAIKDRWIVDNTIIGVITISVNEDDKNHVISIKDNGIGTSDNVDDEQLFEPFLTTKPPGEGVGMGLSVVHKVVTGHHGRVEIKRPDNGIGFEIVIYLPKEEICL
ncbi:MAG: signal transduction histidine kinase [Bacteriovoracaceae bacterium]